MSRGFPFYFMANAAGKLGIRLDGAAGGRAGLGSGLGSGSGAGSGSGTGAGYSDSAGLELSPAAAVILNPYKITICDGEETHYLLPRGSELFSAVVGNGRHFYEEILSRKPARDLAAADWADLVTRRSILIEFKIPIRQDVLKWAIDLYNTALNTPQDMRKLLIVPDDSAGKPAISLYVLSSDKITQFSLDSSDFAGVRTLLNENLRALGGEGAQNIVQYKTIGEFGGSSFPGFRSDVLCVVDGQKTNIYRKLKYSAPTDIRDKGDLEDIVLGNDIYSYNRSLDYSNTLVFKNITSIYRLRKDGFMEYSYTSPIQPFEKGGLVGALRSATEFVLNIETQLLGGADLYLSGIYENESDLTYRITFDYILDDYPVFFQYLQKQGDSTLTYQNAINVLANESRTISCKWTLVDLFFGTDVKRMQTYFQTIDSPESLTKMSVMDISISYYVDMNNYTNSTSLWPVWALELENGEVQMIPLRDG